MADSRKPTVRWNPEERALIARHIYEALHGRLLSSYDREIITAMKTAVGQVLEPDRRRVFSGVSQVKWIRPLLATIYAAEHRPLAIHAAPADGEDTDGEDHQEPVDDEEPYTPPAPDPHMLRRVRRIDRRLRQMVAEQTRAADEVTAITDLLLECLPSLRKQPQLPPLPTIAKTPNAHPLIVVAGLRGSQPEQVQKQAGDVAELVFVDASKRRPKQVGECDLLIATKWCGRSWIDAARAACPGKLAMASGTSEVVRIIKRATGKESGVA